MLAIWLLLLAMNALDYTSFFPSCRGLLEVAALTAIGGIFARRDSGLYGATQNAADLIFAKPLISRFNYLR